MRILATDYGVNGDGDNSPQLQACFDAAVDAGRDVELPPYSFTASIHIRADGWKIPNIYGHSGVTHWYSAGTGNWALIVDVADTRHGKNWTIENVSFRDVFVARKRCGLQVNLSSGPVRLIGCDFRYLAIGCALNGTYALQADSCNWIANGVGLLHTVRKAGNRFSFRDVEIDFVEPYYLQHSGINQLNNCSFSSDVVSWMMEDPDRGIGGASISSVATNCIFQGAGLGVWTRDVKTPANGAGIQFNTTHFEHLQQPPDSAVVDGEEVPLGDAYLSHGQFLFINGSPNRLIQGPFSYCKTLGIGEIIPYHHEMPDNAFFEADVAGAYRGTSERILTNVLLPDEIGGNGTGAITLTLPKIPQENLTAVRVLDAYSGEGVANWPGQWGRDAKRSDGGRVCIIRATKAGSGIRTRSHKPDGYWYYSFAVRADDPVRLMTLNYGSQVNMSFTADENWKTIHGVGKFDKERSLVRIVATEPGEWQIRDFQLVESKNLNELTIYQRARIFPNGN